MIWSSGADGELLLSVECAPEAETFGRFDRSLIRQRSRCFVQSTQLPKLGSKALDYTERQATQLGGLSYSDDQ